MIILCPSIIVDVRGELQSVKDVNNHNPMSNVHISQMQSISSSLLHEFLHLAFDNSSECIS